MLGSKIYARYHIISWVAYSGKKVIGCSISNISETDELSSIKELHSVVGSSEESGARQRGLCKNNYSTLG